VGNQGGTVEDQKIILTIAFDKIIDYTRIVLCFENYYKTMLLVDGYIVHVIKKTQSFKHLSEKQKNTPVTLQELKEIEQFSYDRQSDTFTHPGISIRTLQISQLVSKEYQQMIQTPSHILDSIKSVIRYRNNIHFLLNEEGKLDFAYFRTLANLTKYVDENMVINHNKMALHLGSDKTLESSGILDKVGSKYFNGQVKNTSTDSE
jgi:hypothetical protein